MRGGGTLFYLKHNTCEGWPFQQWHLINWEKKKKKEKPLPSKWDRRTCTVHLHLTDTRLPFTGLAAVTLISCKDTGAQMGGCDRFVCMSRVKSRKDENMDKEGKNKKGKEWHKRREGRKKRVREKVRKPISHQQVASLKLDVSQLCYLLSYKWFYSLAEMNRHNQFFIKSLILLHPWTEECLECLADPWWLGLDVLDMWKCSLKDF